MTSRLPRYEAKCVQRRCFQWGSVPLLNNFWQAVYTRAYVLASYAIVRSYWKFKILLVGSVTHKLLFI